MKTLLNYKLFENDFFANNLFANNLFDYMSPKYKLINPETNNRQWLVGLLLWISTAVTLPAFAASGTADTVLKNGKVYTMNPDKPWAESVAIKNNRIVYVGDTKSLGDFVDNKTKVIDLNGKMAMPGLIDAHVHPILGGVGNLFECEFFPSAGPEQIAETLKGCITANPDKAWVTGGRWDSNFFERHNIGSPIAWLDSISTEKAIALADDTGHNRWVNSKALKLAKLDEPDKTIDGGEIVLDENTGKPNGLLLEAAMYPVLNAIPPFDPKDYLKAAVVTLNQANKYGITALKEAGDSYFGAVAYKQADETKLLNVRMAVAIAIPLLEGTLELDVERLNALRKETTGELVNSNFVKIFLDGVPSVARTAAMIDNYLPEVEGGPSHNGNLLIPPETLNQWVQKLDALGITVNIHAAGDRAARVVIDAVEYARKQNGDSGLVHEIAHGGFIHPDDYERMIKFNVAADQSPAIWFPSPIIESIVSAIGERGNRYWPVKTLLEKNIRVTAGSDWPAVLPNMNPWPGLEAMVTRQHPEGLFPGTQWAEQAVDLHSALTVFLTNNAKALKLQHQIGSLEVGKKADIIVLNQNLFEIPAQKISETEVLMTMFDGRVVYDVALDESHDESLNEYLNAVEAGNE